MFLVQSLIISDPAALKLQTERSIVQETNWPCIRDLSLMFLLEEWCVLMYVQSWKLSLITQKLLSAGRGTGRLMLPGTAASWLRISPEQHWDMLSSGSSGRMSKIMSQAKSRVTLQSLQPLQHPQTQNTSWKWTVARLSPFFFSFFFLSFTTWMRAEDTVWVLNVFLRRKWQTQT